MRKVIQALLFALVLATAIAVVQFQGFAPSAEAHPGHTSCEGGAEEVVDQGLFPQGPGEGPSGAEVAAVSTSGPGAASGTVASVHEVFCEPSA